MVSRTKAIGAIGSLYHALVPQQIRSSRIATRLKRTLPHDWTYNLGYFNVTVEGPAIRSAPRIADTIVNTFKPRSVVDVGCGTGALLETLRDRGCNVFGLEYSEAALQLCRQRRLDVTKFDLESDSLAGDRVFDVAISLEVAEHLPEKSADIFVGLLVFCRLPRTGRGRSRQ
jgi:2-polyprenyl-3-methyl-5-hydroxy-6-metoxy-1,4-benzoquinol methylase